MTTYIETLEKIAGINAEINALKAKTDLFAHRDHTHRLYTEGKTEELRQVEAEFVANAERENTLKRHLTVYKSNAEKLYILENMPKVIDILNKYEGKKCGEKTKDKIRAEAKEAECNMYFRDDSIVFYFGLSGYDTKTVYTKYIDGKQQTITDGENKINKIHVDMFHMPKAENVIEDVESYTQQKEAEFLNIKKMYADLEDAVKAYNENCPFKYQHVRDGVLYMD